MAEIPYVKQKQIDAARSIAEQAVQTNHRHWLPKDPSAAFICCIGAGPWRYTRRRKVQLDALVRLNGRDIVEIDPKEFKKPWFPLDWQNRMLMTVNSKLRANLGGPKTMAYMMDAVKAFPGRKAFYAFCGAPKGPKVLSLFLRDYIGEPAFPVDRHVRRILSEAGLPTTEDEMLLLCRRAHIDPTVLARKLGTQRLDGGNPDWSEWPAKAAPEGVPK